MRNAPALSVSRSLRLPAPATRAWPRWRGRGRHERHSRPAAASGSAARSLDSTMSGCEPSRSGAGGEDAASAGRPSAASPSRRALADRRSVPWPRVGRSGSAPRPEAQRPPRATSASARERTQPNHACKIALPRSRTPVNPARTPARGSCRRQWGGSKAIYSAAEISAWRGAPPCAEQAASERRQP